MKCLARWKLWTSGGGVDGGKWRIEKPLSFCLVKLYMLTRDAPTPDLRLWNRPEQSKVSLPGEYISEVLFSFFSEWRKARLDAPYKTWTQNISLRYLPLWCLKQRVAQATSSFDSLNHLSIVWFTGLFKKGTLQLSVVVLLPNSCLTMFDNRIPLLLKKRLIHNPSMWSDRLKPRHMHPQQVQITCRFIPQREAGRSVADRST